MAENYIDTELKTIIFNKVSAEKYAEMLANGEINDDEFYITPSTSDEESSGGTSLPDQIDNAGKYLTTDGSDVSWGEIDLSSKQDVLANDQLFFWTTFDTTTFDEITVANNDGKIIACKYNDMIYFKSYFGKFDSDNNEHYGFTAINSTTLNYLKIDSANVWSAETLNFNSFAKSEDVYTKDEVDSKIKLVSTEPTTYEDGVLYLVSEEE